MKNEKAIERERHRSIDAADAAVAAVAAVENTIQLLINSKADNSTEHLPVPTNHSVR